MTSNDGRGHTHELSRISPVSLRPRSRGVLLIFNGSTVHRSIETRLDMSALLPSDELCCTFGRCIPRSNEGLKHGTSLLFRTMLAAPVEIRHDFISRRAAAKYRRQSVRGGRSRRWPNTNIFTNPAATNAPWRDILVFRIQSLERKNLTMQPPKESRTSGIRYRCHGSIKSLVKTSSPQETLAGARIPARRISPGFAPGTSR